LRWFKPAVHLHGHVHIYDRNEIVECPYADSTVINVYPYRRLLLDTSGSARAKWIAEERDSGG
jgi:hypothetical protein